VRVGDRRVAQQHAARAVGGGSLPRLGDLVCWLFAWTRRSAVAYRRCLASPPRPGVGAPTAPVGRRPRVEPGEGWGAGPRPVARLVESAGEGARAAVLGAYVTPLRKVTPVNPGRA
jgi:hypothetical protein